MSGGKVVVVLVDVVVVVGARVVVVLVDCGGKVVVVDGGPGTHPNSSCISFNDSETGGVTHAFIVTAFSYYTALAVFIATTSAFNSFTASITNPNNFS